jgi:hypothetical protein
MAMLQQSGVWPRSALLLLPITKHQDVTHFTEVVLTFVLRKGMGVATISRFVLAFLMLLSLGLGPSVPAEDVPETAYDESEALPFDGTPLFSIVVPQASARVTKAEFDCGPPLRLNSFTRSCACGPENSAESRCVPDSLTIINHCLRC